MTKAKLIVETRPTLGAKMVPVGEARTVAEARKIAAKYSDRRDLTYQDVVIRLGNGKIEFAGPCR